MTKNDARQFSKQFFLCCQLEQMALGKKYLKIDDQFCRSIFIAYWWTKIRFADDNPTNSVRLK